MIGKRSRYLGDPPGADIDAMLQQLGGAHRDQMSHRHSRHRAWHVFRRAADHPSKGSQGSHLSHTSQVSQGAFPKDVEYGRSNRVRNKGWQVESGHGLIKDCRWC